MYLRRLFAFLILLGSTVPLVAQQDPSWLAANRMLDRDRAWMTASSTLLRFYVKQDGLYRIDSQWFTSAGVNAAALQPEQVKLYRFGVEIPMYREGMEDGRFDEGDAFFFAAGPPRFNDYRRLPTAGEEYPEYMYRYSDSTAYWIVIDVRPAAVMHAVAPPSGARDTLQSLYRTIHIEQDASLQYLGTNTDVLNDFHWSSGKTWITTILSRARSWPLQVDIPAVDPTRACYVLARMTGYQGTASVSPNHRVSIEVEGAGERDSITFDLGEHLLFSVDVPPAVLSEGRRTITMHSRPREDERSSVAFDWIDVDVPAHLVAIGGRFVQSVVPGRDDGITSLRIAGFASSDVLAFRVDGDSVALLDVAAIAGGDGTYDAIISDTLRANRKYCVTERNAAIGAPAALSVTQPTLRSETTGAQAVIITAEQLRAAAAQYAQFTQSELGKSALLVVVDDIYNEYSFGMPEPEALRLFLFDAVRRWSSPPASALLLGDANVDPRAASGAFRESLVPSLGWPASDAAMVSFDSLGVEQEILVGRIPARSGADILSYLERHRSYRNAAGDLWNKTTLHFSGGEYYENDAQLSFYRNINDLLIDAIVEPPPFGGRASHLYKTAEPVRNFAPLGDEGMKALVRRGAFAISYVGHSATTTWDNSVSKPAQLKSDDPRGSIITDFGCSSARFAEPDISSFGELCIESDDAPAIAYIGNAAFGARSTGVSFPPLFYDELLRGDSQSLGEILRNARARLLQEQGNLPAIRNAITMSTLLGDPLLAPSLPRQPDLVLPEGAISTTSEIVTDAMDSLLLNLGVWNYGRVPNAVVTLKVSLLDGADTLSTVSRRIPVPALVDSIDLAFPSPKRPGELSVIAVIDADNEVVESNENNNRAEYRLIILGSRFKVVNSNAAWTNAAWDRVRLLNPAAAGGSISDVRYEADSTERFDSPRSFTGVYGHVTSSDQELSTLAVDISWYWHASALPGPEQWTDVQRMRTNAGRGVIQSDARDFVRNELTRLRIEADVVRTLGSLRRLRLSSAGALAGASASVQIDEEEMLPLRTFDGYGVVVVDSASFVVKDVRIFNTMTSVADADAFSGFLLSRAPDELLAVVAAGNPTTNRTRFSAALRATGSIQIDSVDDRGSFACIGRRGAAPGTIPELRRARLEAPALIDTMYDAAAPSGLLLTPWAGPASSWTSLRVAGEHLDSARTGLMIIGRGLDGDTDTLVSEQWTAQLQLTGIDASRYPWLRAGIRLLPLPGVVPPAIHEVRLDFTHAPELALNDQSVHLVTDSLAPGEEARLQLGLINAGEAAAAGSRIEMLVYGPLGDPLETRNIPVPELSFMQRFDTLLVLNSNTQAGRYRIAVRADADNEVIEQVENNNSFIVPFIISHDSTAPSLRLLIDDTEAMDGDVGHRTPDQSCNSPSVHGSRTHHSATGSGSHTA